MAATQDVSTNSIDVPQSSQRALNVVLIVCAVVTVVLAMVWAGALGATSGQDSRRSFAPYDWSGSQSVGSSNDSGYPSARVGG